MIGEALDVFLAGFEQDIGPHGGPSPNPIEGDRIDRSTISRPSLRDTSRRSRLRS